MIEVNNLEKTYNFGKSNAFKALRGISLTIGTGELVAITGKSGSGKSTLLHVLACIDDFEAGEILLDGQSITLCNDQQLAFLRNSKIGLVLQDFALINDCTALENVTIPLYFNKEVIKKRKEKAFDALTKVGMKDFAQKEVHQLSGGEKQRVAIARALINDPTYIFADGPTGSLDSENSTIIIEILKSLKSLNKTIIIVTHDTAIANTCDRILHLSDGRLVLCE